MIPLTSIHRRATGLVGIVLFLVLGFGDVARAQDPPHVEETPFSLLEGESDEWKVDGADYVLVTNNGTGRIVVVCKYGNGESTETRSLLPGESYKFVANGTSIWEVRISVDDDGKDDTQLTGIGSITIW